MILLAAELAACILFIMFSARSLIRLQYRREVLIQPAEPSADHALTARLEQEIRDLPLPGLILQAERRAYADLYPLAAWDPARITVVPNSGSEFSDYQAEAEDAIARHFAVPSLVIGLPPPAGPPLTPEEMATARARFTAAAGGPMVAVPLHAGEPPRVWPVMDEGALRQERQVLWEQAKGIAERAAAENRPFTAGEQDAWAALGSWMINLDQWIRALTGHQAEPGSGGYRRVPGRNDSTGCRGYWEPGHWWGTTVLHGDSKPDGSWVEITVPGDQQRSWIPGSG